MVDKRFMMIGRLCTRDIKTKGECLKQKHFVRQICHSLTRIDHLPVGAADTAAPVERSHHALGHRVMVLGTVFVTSDLTIELVDQLIDRGVEVFVGTLGKQIATLDPNIALSALALFFLFLFLDRQQHLDIDHLIKMPHDPIQFVRYIISQGWGHFQMMAADGEIHACTPWVGLIRWFDSIMRPEWQKINGMA
jgi:hypothetical protein